MDGKMEDNDMVFAALHKSRQSTVENKPPVAFKSSDKIKKYHLLRLGNLCVMLMLFIIIFLKWYTQ